MYVERRDLFEEKFSQKKMIFGSQQGQIANGQTAITNSPTLFASERQISGLLPTSNSIENQNDSDSSLSPHLACFLVYLIGRLYFCLRGSLGLAVSLAIGGIVLMAEKVVVSLSR